MSLFISVVTFVGVLNACASVVGLEEGRCAHEQIIQSVWDLDVFVGNSLGDMYAKRGSMEDVQRAFNKIPSQDAGHLECSYIGTCETWTRAEGTGTIPTNVTRCVAQLTLLLLWNSS
jgi:hypothetical protein